MFPFSVNCAPAEDNDDSEYPQDGEDIYDDNYDEKEEDKDRKASTTETNEIYKIDNYTETIDTGKNVRLECKGEFDETAVVMWYNGTRIIVQGQAYTGNSDKRIQFSKKDGSLTIEGVDSYDNAMYKCRAFYRNELFETNVQLIVNGPPKMIKIGHNRDNSIISGKELTYKEGKKDLRFKCIIENAHPEAKITWIHNGNAIQESEDSDIKFVDESILEIQELHARHAGDYECEAANEYGSAKAEFKIDVLCEYERKIYLK